MKIYSYKKGDEESVKKFVSESLEEIFHSPSKGLEDLDNIEIPLNQAPFSFGISIYPFPFWSGIIKGNVYIDENFELFLVAKENDKIIGTIGVKKENDCARISRMYVNKIERGKGIGESLIKKALLYCKRKFNRVFLTTYEQMNSVGFYEKMCFKAFKKEGDVIWMEMFFDK